MSKVLVDMQDAMAALSQTAKNDPENLIMVTDLEAAGEIIPIEGT